MSNKKPYPNIYAELARAGLTTATLSEYMGMTRQNVSNKLNGKTTFSLKDMETIKEYLKEKTGNDFSLDYLFKSGE